MGASPPQSKAIRTDLVRAMREGEYARVQHLPPEMELAQTLGISRTQLRDVLAVLEQEGFITRRHGVGTVINRHVVDIPVRMDIETEFQDMIRQSGFFPGTAFVRCLEEEADQYVADCLHIPLGTPILRVCRLCTADGRPAIYCEDVVRRDLVPQDLDPCQLDQSIFQFLSACGQLEPYIDLTDLRPVVADAKLAEVFQLPAGSPLLNMREVDYDITGQPLFCSFQYFADGFFRHTVLRKKL